MGQDVMTEEDIWRRSLDEAIELYDRRLVADVIEASSQVEVLLSIIRVEEERIKGALKVTESSIEKLEEAVKERDQLARQRGVINRFLVAMDKRKSEEEGEDKDEDE